jgi:dipeptidyl aminopeptidase/acylaminoacyl peptidase
VEKSLRTGAERLLGRSEKSDLLATLGAAGKRGVRALAFEVAGRLAWTPIDWRVKEDLEGLRLAVTGDFVVLGADRADGRWVVEERRDVAAPRYLLWDRKARRAEVLFSARPGLAGLPLVERQALSLVARDGQGLAGYLARPARAGSLVVLVQGGPAERDGWGYDGLVQLLANRGHAVLQVNARGSSGAGKRFLAAGNRAPGLLLEDDLVDAAAWAVREGLAEPARVAVMGVGPGGAVALAALARAPDAFACGVDLEGPLSPAGALASLPAWRAAARPRLRARLGLLESPPDAGAESPAERVKAPLLLATRGLEGSAPHDEARRLVAALRARGVEVTWVTSPELVSPERRLDLVGRAEAFLARCLQGRAEPPAAPEAR